MQIVDGYICMNCCDVDKARLGSGSASANKSDQKAAQADNRSTAVTATWPGSYLRWIAAGAGGWQRGDRRRLIADDVGRERAGFLVERQRACPAIRPASAIEQPQNGAQDDADDDAGDEREIEAGAAALDHDITRETSDPDPREDRPCDPNDQDHQTKPDQKSLDVHR
jgi:hypothetical protein